jgi:hypothetical protein
MKLWIPGEFPSMNKTVAAAKSGRGRGNAYSRLKKEWTEFVKNWVRSQYGAVPHGEPVRLSFHWTTADARTDADNVSSAKKYVIDGLVAAGVLSGDGRRVVVGFGREDFEVGDQPGVTVTIEAA